MSRAALIAMLGCLGAGAVNADSVRATGAEAPAGEDGQWSMPSKDYAATRYSGLTGITRQNAGSLHPVWTFSTGILGGHEGQRRVAGDTLYDVTPWPIVLYAFALTQEGYPLRWYYQ